jgi:hypothetical protein
MNLIKWIINDLKNDWDMLKTICEGKAKFDPSRITGPKMFVLFCILSFACGAWVSAMYLQNQANEVIYEQCQDNMIMLGGEWNNCTSSCVDKDCIGSCLMANNDNKPPNKTFTLPPNINISNFNVSLD